MAIGLRTDARLIEDRWPLSANDGGRERMTALRIISRWLDFNGTNSLFPAAVRVGQTVREMERELIMKTLQTVSENRTRAAEMLGISIRTLRNKLNEYKARAPGGAAN